MNRVLVVSNRLPVQLKSEGGKWHAQPSSGGLVSALSGIRDELDFRWIGWPGTAVPKEDEGPVKQLLEKSLGYVPLFLESGEVDRFYDGFCNSVLWPLFHYLPGRVDFGLPNWDEYRRVNERFADLVLSQCEETSTVWIHDYHLLLLPTLLREKMPHLRIGFFLHIPFPSSELYRLLPVRREILRGLMGSDLIGFHTHDYGRHFSSSALRVLGATSTPSDIRFEGRKIRYGSYPIGINLAPFQEMLESKAIETQRQALSDAYSTMKIVLGVDRIDYIKGLPLKLRAYELFLDQHPQWRGRVVLIQVGIPSRLSVKEYQQVKSEVDELVGRINGRFGNSKYSPIQYVAHGVPFDELCALYERADALLVSSIRDGMNLVSLEYAACQKERHGALILSEFAGAAKSMGGSLLINPWDVQQTADAIDRALSMDADERTTRALQNFTYVRGFHSIGWARRFLKDLSAGTYALDQGVTDLMTQFIQLKRDFQRQNSRLLLLDYDGTLVPFTGQPVDAKPSEHLLRILETLAMNPKNTIYLISGRSTQDMDRWFSELPISLSAEHGLFLKEKDASEWRQRGMPSMDWMLTVERILNDYARRIPGSIVERKQSSLAWHFREADQDFAEWQALELTLYLDSALSNLPVRVLQGNKVVEIRPQGFDKGTLVREILETKKPDPNFILCLGDDRTDEDMFAVLPGWAWTCRIGEGGDTQARYFLENPDEVLELLEELAHVS